LVLGTASVWAGGKADAAKPAADTAAPAAKAAEISISWQVWITPNLTRTYYDEVVAAFEAKNPGIKVKIVEANAATSGAANDFIKMRLAAGDVPDVWTNLDVAVFAEAGQLWEIPVNDPDLKKINGNPMDAAYKGKVYSFFPSVQPQGCMFYNKTMFKTAGITTLPKTWTEFEAACAKLKAAGFTPIITGGEWVPGLIINNVLSTDLAKNKPNYWTDVYAGKATFVTTPEVVDGIAGLQSLVDKGYFNKGALSIGYADLEGQFLAGKAAIYPMGSWFTAAEAAAKKDFEVGVFSIPTRDGKPSLVASTGYGTAPAVYAKSKNPEAAWKLAKFYVMDPVYGAKFIQVDGLFSNLNPPLEYPMSQLQKDLAALVPTVKFGNLQHRLGDAGANGFFDPMTKVGQLILAEGSKAGSPVTLAKIFDDYVASLK
jgi:ABC-type glycerol-3-phosphate transport system substrate-binding protein